MKFIDDKCEFCLSQGEVKVFSLDFVSDRDGDFFVKVSGVNGVCLQTTGRDRFGKEFDSTMKFVANNPVRLWFALRGSNNQGIERGKVRIVNESVDLAEKEVIVKTTGDTAIASQFENIKSLNRLVWLNSDRAINDVVPKPFTPINADGLSVRFLGREIVLSETGLPKEINSFFNDDIKICGEKTNILDNEISFSCGTPLLSKSFSLSCATDKAIVDSSNENEDFIVEIYGEINFDGFISYKITLKAKNDIYSDNLSLIIPIAKECRSYFMGLSEESGCFKGILDWKWDKDKQQDGFWIGAVNAGVKFEFKDENYVKPLCNIYYAYKPLIDPECWCNGGKGGIKFSDDTFVAYTGRKKFRRGEKTTFCFDMTVTPLKEIDYNKQFSMRFYQKLGGTPDEWLCSAMETGANFINVHHGTELNPYINYPFFENDALSDFVKKAHFDGIKVKEYYTIRELSVNAPEFAAFRDFGYEIIEKNDKQLKGNFWQSDAKQWIYDHIGKDVIPAWRQEIFRRGGRAEFDASVITNGCSRLCNFYIESLDYLLKTTDLDGIYIDDSAFDRETMKRVRRVLDAREGRYIDFHTWNHDFNDFAGHAKSLFLYMELLPYIDKLWVGEGFDYTRSADYWLVEISGIPFGLTSDMLENDEQLANPWKGLLFGMTTRAGWYEKSEALNPKGIWKVFDDYGLTNSEFIGWWSKKNSVKLSDVRVKASVYRTKKYIFIALANFSDEDAEISVVIEDKPAERLIRPEVGGLQTFDMIVGNKIKISKNGGAFIKFE